MAERTERVNIITSFSSQGVQAYAQQTSQAGQATQQLDKGTRASGKSVNALTGILSKAGIALTVAFAVKKVFDFGKAMVATAKQIEQAERSISIFTGSLNAAKVLIQSLEDLAIRTPFETEQFISAGRELLKFGVNAKDVTPILEDLAEVSVATGADMNQIATILGRVQSQGKATFRELTGIVASGIPIYNLLADSLGVSVGQVKKLGQEGKITSTQLITAFQRATDEGGKFHGVLEAQSNTIAGIQKRIKGELSNALQSLGRLFGPTIKEAFKGIINLFGSSEDKTSLLGKLKELANSDAPQRLAASFAAFFAFVGQSAKPAFAAIKVTLNSIILAVSTFRAGIGAAAIAVGKMTGNADLLAFGFAEASAAAADIKAELGNIKEGVQSAFDIKNPLAEARRAFKETLAGLKDDVIEFRGRAFGSQFKKNIVETVVGDPGELQAARDSLADLQKRLEAATKLLAFSKEGTPVFVKATADVKDLTFRVRELEAEIVKLTDTTRKPIEIKTIKTKDFAQEFIDEAKRAEQEAIRLIEQRAELIERANEDRDNRALRLQRDADTNLASATIEARKILLDELKQIDEKDHKGREAAFLKFDKAITDARVEAAQKNVTAAIASQDGLAILDAQDALLHALIEQLLDAGNELTKLQKGALAVGDFIGNQIIPIIDGIQQLTDQLEESAQRAVEIQERRVADAAKLAEKGNAELLQIEEDRLAKSEERQRRAAQLTRELAALQFAANSAVAISRVAAETGIFSPAGIAILIATLAGGIAQAKALSQGFEKGTESVEGQPGKDKIIARLTRKERVVPVPINEQLNGIPNADLPDAVKLWYAFQSLPVVKDHSSDKEARSFKSLERQMQRMNDNLVNMRMFLHVDEFGILTGVKGAELKYQRKEQLFE